MFTRVRSGFPGSSSHLSSTCWSRDVRLSLSGGNFLLKLRFHVRFVYGNFLMKLRCHVKFFYPIPILLGRVFITSFHTLLPDGRRTVQLSAISKSSFRVGSSPVVSWFLTIRYQTLHFRSLFLVCWFLNVAVCWFFL